MKKLICYVLSIASAATVFCLTACGSGAAKVRGEEVSKDNWSAAFATGILTNVRIEERKDVTCKSGFSTSGSASYRRTIIFSDGNVHVVSEQTVKGDISFYIENKAFYDWTPEPEYTEYYIEGASSESPIYYIKTDGGFEKKTELSSSEATAYRNVYTEYAFAFSDFSSSFDGYRYETDYKGGYAPTEAVPKSYLLKINDGLLKALYVPEISFEDGKNKYRYDEGVVYSYGGEVVTLPEI